MNEKKNRKAMSIGIPSMVLIFITMCMATLGVLSLKKTQSYWRLVEKNGQAVQEYYAADSKGEEYLRQAAQAPGTVPNMADIPMRENQVLHIELESGEENSALRIAVWKVMNLQDYVIDNSMPVWTGE